MLGEYGEAWFYPDFLFARPPIELMGASGFLGYTYTEGGAGTWKGKAGVNLRGRSAPGVL